MQGSSSAEQSPPVIRVLLVEDSSGYARLIREMLRDQADMNFELSHASRLSEGLAFLDRRAADVVLLDLNLPDSSWPGTLLNVLSKAPDVPVVVLTGFDNAEMAVKAVRSGAQDYLVKGQIDSNLLARTIRYAIEHRKATESMRLAAKVMESALEGIFVTDREFNIINVNPSFADITGMSAEEVIGRNPSVMGSGGDETDKYKQIGETIRQGGNWRGEVWNRRKGGEVYTAWLNVSSIKDNSGNITNYVGVFTDITQRKLVEEHLDHMAHYDGLTGLPNRALLHDRLGHALVQLRRSGQRLAILFIDLDEFKPVNDAFGHDVGDLVLQDVARRLKLCVRESDTVARLGGDEFIIILQDIMDEQDAVLVAKKIIGSLQMPFCPRKDECSIGASIGITIYPDDGTDAETLLKRADRAMYYAKEKGKNNWKLFSSIAREGKP